MAFTEKQKILIEHIDANVNQIVAEGGDDADILSFFSEISHDGFESILNSSEQKDLDECCQQYKGFYKLVTLLNNEVAFGVSKRKSKFWLD